MKMQEYYGWSLVKHKLSVAYQHAAAWVNRWRGTLSPWLKVLVWGYILIQIVRLFPKYATLFKSLQLSTVVIGVLSMILAVGGLGWVWVGLVRLLGIHLPGPQGLYIYSAANLARYLPGGIWHFAGRVALLKERGGTVSASMWSLGIEQVAVFLSALLVSGLTSVLKLPEVMFVRFLPILVACVFGSSIILVGKCSSWKCNVVWKWVTLFLSYPMFWILYGSAASIFWASLTGWQPISLQDFVNLIGYTSLSWVAGYVVFFVPGGWGIREVVYARLLSASLPQDLANFIPALMRLSQILSEVVCFALATVWNLGDDWKNLRVG